MSEAPKLSQVIRLDSLPLNQTYFTPEGYLMDRPILTSTGIFEYTCLLYTSPSPRDCS